MLVDNLDAQAALDRPRLCLGPAGDVALEQGVARSVREELAAMGHAVRVVRGHERALFGRGQIITRDPDSGVLCGGSDLRADGCALGI
jgi:gamma-glutamyltranspeptidase/glutathione hydrolase